MSNTYTQIHIHFVFAVKYRRAIICKSWRDSLYKFITGIVQNHGHRMIVINGVEDHIHLLVGLHPNKSISDLMKNVKQFSSKWINDNKLTFEKFEWQQGYGAFSTSKSQMNQVVKYIMNQEEHHEKHSFKEEYLKFLEKYEVEYDEKFTFKDLN